MIEVLLSMDLSSHAVSFISLLSVIFLSWSLEIVAHHEKRSELHVRAPKLRQWASYYTFISSWTNIQIITDTCALILASLAGVDALASVNRRNL